MPNKKKWSNCRITVFSVMRQHALAKPLWAHAFHLRPEIQDNSRDEYKRASLLFVQLCIQICRIAILHGDRPWPEQCAKFESACSGLDPYRKGNWDSGRGARQAIALHAATKHTSQTCRRRKGKHTHTQNPWLRQNWALSEGQCKHTR